MSRRISSRENPVFRQLLRITTSARERRQLAVSFIEGVHLCQSYRARFGAPRQVIHTAQASQHPEARVLIEQALNSPLSVETSGLPGGHCIELGDGLFGELSQVEHGIGIAYVIDTPVAVMPSVIDDDCVYLDGLQDPGNVGTILRTCAAVGVSRVITAPGTAWCWSPKVLRAGMGAHFALAIHESIGWDQLAPLLRVPVMATAPQADRTVWAADLSAPRLWLFGAEGSGLNPARSGPGMHWVSLPQRPAVESLNVAVAAAVCLFEQLRQRSQPG
jgi:TrmH family RNA methyltransferase